MNVSQRGDKQRGGPVSIGFREVVNGSWEEGGIQRKQLLRKALIITFSFEPDIVPLCACFHLQQGVCRKEMFSRFEDYFLNSQHLLISLTLDLR